MIQTLSRSTLATCSPIAGESGHVIRAYCPFHGSDHQRSLRVDVVAGRFKCFACGVWGYLEGQQWRRNRRPTRVQIARAAYFGFKLEPSGGTAAPRPSPEPTPLPADVLTEYQAYRKALPGSPAEAYLAERGICFDTAWRYGAGYAARGKWAHRTPEGRPIRQWSLGRVVFPETNPRGQIVNLYGRAIGAAPKEKAHDHLPGMKGYFNTGVIRLNDGPLFITEGVFDALSLMAAGCWRTVAIIGVNGVRWSWLDQADELIIVFDSDQTGQASAHELVRAAILRGKRARVLPPEVYGGLKDASEAGQAGVLDIDGWC